MILLALFQSTFFKEMAKELWREAMVKPEKPTANLSSEDGFAEEVQKDRLVSKHLRENSPTGLKDGAHEDKVDWKADEVAQETWSSKTTNVRKHEVGMIEDEDGLKEGDTAKGWSLKTVDEIDEMNSWGKEQKRTSEASADSYVHAYVRKESENKAAREKERASLEEWK